MLLTQCSVLTLLTASVVSHSGLEAAAASQEWLDSLKESVRLASSYNWDNTDLDLASFQGQCTTAE